MNHIGTKKQLKTIHLSLILSLVFLYACVPNGERRSSSMQTTDQSDQTSGSPGTSAPTSGEIYLKYNGQLTLDTIHIDETSAASFALQGQPVNHYIMDHASEESCLALHFNNAPHTGSNAHHILLLSAIKQYYFNYTATQNEYVWLMKPLAQTINTTKCNNPALLTQVANDYGLSSGTYSVIYKASDAAPYALSRLSRPLKIYKADGSPIALSFANHRVHISARTSSTAPTGCNHGVPCPSGQCCSLNQCVTHGQVKPGVDESAPAFINVYQNILAGHDSFANHQAYFYVCNSQTGQTGDNQGTPVNHNHAAQVELTKLGEYLECSLGDIDEMGICTKRYDNAQALIRPNLSAPIVGHDFNARIDDLNFTTVNPAIIGTVHENNIVEIIYGGKTLYSELATPSVPLLASDGHFLASPNDNVLQAQAVHIKAPLPANALDQTLIIKYKADVSCKKMNAALARCTKFYHIGQTSTPPRPSDSPAGANLFSLPSYADLTTYQSAVVVKVDGVITPIGLNWNWLGSQINFTSPLVSGQKVEITYFVQSSMVNNVSISGDLASTAINDHCRPGVNSYARLTPNYTNENGQQVITSYSCQYYQEGGIPAEQLVNFSSQVTPHLYYDQGGILKHENEISAALPQELAHGVSKFEYVGGNLLKPNNTTPSEQYIGFNEIYGSFKSSGTSAEPAKQVPVKKGKLYNISVQQGSYSPCPTCGNDYYSSLVKLFPHNFSYNGGGIKPDLHIASHQTPYYSIRQDDFLHGRACFVPATMIPWTHRQRPSITEQRRDRLRAQHFLFANGYQRDWYGFDYGSLIGSFDGVRWFSIGNQRRITANSPNLYLAINAYFADTSLSANYQVRVSEVISSLGSAVPNHDTETDGAQCQKAHFCHTDKDCLTQLGHDYACVNINEIYTPWPRFNGQGREILGSETKRLSIIVGGTNGQSKRCVYRGAGSLCSSNILSPGTGSPYNSNASNLHTCSTSTHCADLATASKFNDKIARYAKPLLSQNLATYISQDTDLIGLGARVMGRPLNYQGTNSVPPATLSHLQDLNVTNICVNGRQGGTSTTFQALHNSDPEPGEYPKILNTGTTGTGSPTSPTDTFLSACPILDGQYNYLHTGSQSLGDDEVITKAVMQNISSNLLDHPDYQYSNIFNDGSSLITEKGVRHNSCLKTAGTPCFSDLECAPNKDIAFKASNVSSSLLNEAERAFWQEGLICGQKEKPKTTAGIDNPDYQLTNNVCCREVGKTITIYSHDNTTPIYNNKKIAGIDMGLQNNERYSRLHTLYDKIKERNASPAEADKTLLKPTSTSGTTSFSKLIKGYEDFHAIASKTCCGGSWVRNFHDDNGGGHTWIPSKAQDIKKDSLKTLSWRPYSGNNFLCGPDGSTVNPAYNTADCTIANLSSEEQKRYLNFFASLELLGIPQVAIIPVPPLIVSSTSMGSPSTSTTIPQTVKTTAHKSISGSSGSGEAVSGAYEAAHFESNIKPIFSENTFSCCESNGTIVSTPQTCCSGKAVPLSSSNPTRQKCCLPNYTNVSVYLNRYVSSEAVGVFPDSAFQPKTGYLTNPHSALAVASSMCCSGHAAQGSAIETLGIPGAEIHGSTKRFIYRNTDVWSQDLVNAPSEAPVELYNNGQRWNNQIYCVPASGGSSSGSTGSSS